MGAHVGWYGALGGVYEWVVFGPFGRGCVGFDVSPGSMFNLLHWSVFCLLGVVGLLGKYRAQGYSMALRRLIIQC